MLSFKNYLTEKKNGNLKDACWAGYEAIGMKDKGGKKVPNCVPVKEESKKDCECEKECSCEDNLDEATYQGKTVPLNKPMAGDVKKSKVYVDPDGDGKAQKVNFGDKNMTIKKNIPARRKSFRARHHCDTNPGPKTKARYWSCRAW